MPWSPHSTTAHAAVTATWDPMALHIWGQSCAIYENYPKRLFHPGNPLETLFQSLVPRWCIAVLCNVIWSKERHLFLWVHYTKSTHILVKDRKINNIVLGKSYIDSK